MFDKNEALACVGDTGDRNGSTVGKIYTPIFWFFRKRVVNIAILEVGRFQMKALLKIGVIMEKSTFSQNFL